MPSFIRSSILTGAALLLAGGLSAAPPNVVERQHNQQQRIRQGVRSGSLTGGEAARLGRSSARIHHSIARDRHDQGAFTPRERIQAQHKLNQQSRRIAALEHDNPNPSPAQ
ncbi:MAG: hypothetical protein GC160_00665 [Acidobacteria bacterium]|nr:hypothetical protein [Acidobacteriota bacterium]